MTSILSHNKFIFAFLISIVPFFVLSYFANPFAEDFGFATMAQNKNPMELLKISYTGMNGRYMANIFMYLSPLTFNSFLGYKLAPCILIALTFVSFRFMVNQIFSLNNRIKVAIALGITASILCGLPIASEGLFWYTGASIYYIGMITSAFAFGQLLKTLQSKPSSLKYMLSALLLFIACGFNETQTALNILLVLLVAISQFQRNTQHKFALLFLIATIIIAGLFMYTAPGNANRASMYTANTHDLVHSVLYSFAQLGRFLSDWVISLPLIATTLLFVLKHKTICAHSKLIEQGFYMNKWMTLSLLFVPILLAVFPAYWFTGILGQHRTLNVGFWMFLIVWFVNLSAWLTSSKRLRSVSIPVKSNVLAVIIALGCLFTDNGFYAITDIVIGKAHRFDEQMNQRHELLAKTPNKPGVTLKLDPISAKPTLLFVGDIKDDPNYWMNLGYNDYFRLNHIQISLRN